MAAEQHPNEAKPSGKNLALLDPSVLMPIYDWQTTGRPLNVSGLLCLFQLSEALVLHEGLIVPESWRSESESFQPIDEVWLKTIGNCFQLHGD